MIDAPQVAEPSSLALLTLGLAGSGKYSHQILNGIGHNVPQEAPHAFAKAVIEVDGS